LIHAYPPRTFSKVAAPRFAPVRALCSFRSSHGNEMRIVAELTGAGAMAVVKYRERNLFERSVAALDRRESVEFHIPPRPGRRIRRGLDLYEASRQLAWQPAMNRGSRWWKVFTLRLRSAPYLLFAPAIYLIYVLAIDKGCGLSWRETEEGMVLMLSPPRAPPE
jgi:hypothetical protein